MTFFSYEVGDQYTSSSCSCSGPSVKFRAYCGPQVKQFAHPWVIHKGRKEFHTGGGGAVVIQYCTHWSNKELSQLQYVNSLRMSWDIVQFSLMSYEHLEFNTSISSSAHQTFYSVPFSCLSSFREEHHTCAHRWIYFLYYLLKTQQFVINTCSACAGKESKEMW